MRLNRRPSGPRPSGRWMRPASARGGQRARRGDALSRLGLRFAHASEPRPAGSASSTGRPEHLPDPSACAMDLVVVLDDFTGATPITPPTTSAKRARAAAVRLAGEGDASPAHDDEAAGDLRVLERLGDPRRGRPLLERVVERAAWSTSACRREMSSLRFGAMTRHAGSQPPATIHARHDLRALRSACARWCTAIIGSARATRSAGRCAAAR